MATDYEPGKIPAGGPTAAIWGNGDLKDAFDPLTPDPSYEAAQQFEQAANLWAQGVDTFARSIHRSISEAWEGASAEAAKTAIQNYTQKANDLTPLLEQLTDHMADSATAVVNTKKAIPDTVVVTWTSYMWPPHRFDLENRQGNHRQEAWEAYTTNYVKPLGDIDTTIPVLPRADDAAHPSDIPAPVLGTGPAPSGPGSPAPSAPGGPNSPDAPGTQQPDTGQPTNPTDTQSQSPSTTTTSGTPTDPSTTTGSPTGSPTVPSGVTPSGLTPGSPDFPGGPGDPGTIPGGPGGPGGPGSSIPGSTTPGSPTNPAAGRLATGTAGMAGMPGMGAAGNKKGEEDGEHKTPDYLITAESTRELLGDVSPTVPGGVIGDRPRD